MSFLHAVRPRAAEPDYVVVWSGAIEAAEIRAQQQQAPPPHKPGWGEPAQVSVLAFLRLVEDATLSEIATALGETMSRVNSGIYALQVSGEVTVAKRTVRSAAGRFCRSYRAVSR
jgi:hypothetical protein